MLYFFLSYYNYALVNKLLLMTWLSWWRRNLLIEIRMSAALYLVVGLIEGRSCNKKCYRATSMATYDGWLSYASTFSLFFAWTLESP